MKFWGIDPKKSVPRAATTGTNNSTYPPRHGIEKRLDATYGHTRPSRFNTMSHLINLSDWRVVACQSFGNYWPNVFNWLEVRRTGGPGQQSSIFCIKESLKSTGNMRSCILLLKRSVTEASKVGQSHVIHIAGNANKRWSRLISNGTPYHHYMLLQKSSNCSCRHLLCCKQSHFLTQGSWRGCKILESHVDDVFSAVSDWGAAGIMHGVPYDCHEAIDSYTLLLFTVMDRDQREQQYC